VEPKTLDVESHAWDDDSSFTTDLPTIGNYANDVCVPDHALKEAFVNGPCSSYSPDPTPPQSAYDPSTADPNSPEVLPTVPKVLIRLEEARYF
jgi:hypothetical protein